MKKYKAVIKNGKTVGVIIWKESFKYEDDHRLKLRDATNEEIIKYTSYK